MLLGEIGDQVGDLERLGQPPQVVGAGQLEQPGAGNVVREPAAVLDAA